MRIGFIGKGGSGKTTYAALFAHYLAEQKVPVLAIDADINQHLAKRIGLSEEKQKEIPRLDERIGAIRTHLQGNNARITSPSLFTKTTPPGRGSTLISIHNNDPVIKNHSLSHNGIFLMKTGDYTEEDIGIACFHGKVSAVENIMTHLADSINEWILVDMTAGADSFSSGLFAQFDILFMTVEPAESSFDVYHQFKEFGTPYNIHIKVIGNKVEDAADETYIRERVKDDVIALVPRHPWIKHRERGMSPLPPLPQELFDVLARMRQEAARVPHDHKKFHAHAVAFHAQNADSWMSARYGVNLKEQCDPSYDFAEAASQHHTIE